MEESADSKAKKTEGKKWFQGSQAIPGIKKEIISPSESSEDSDVHGTRPPHLGRTRTSGTLSKCPCPTNVQTNQMSVDMSYQNF